MALSMINYELKNGLSAQNAYVRIDSISGNKSVMSLDVKVYANQQAFSEAREFVDSRVYDFVPAVSDDAINYHKQGYEHLKSLPEYSAAVDVLEQGQSA